MTKEWLKENLSFFEYSNVFEILDRGFEATAGCGLFSSFFFFLFCFCLTEIQIPCLNC